MRPLEPFHFLMPVMVIRSLAVGSLGTAVAGVGWPSPGSLTNTNTEGTNFVLVMDLNGDGIPDLV